MKRLIARFLLLAGVLSLPLMALDVPDLKGRVNDYANMLSPGVTAALEAKLADFEKSDSTQIVVLTIPTLRGELLEEFSMKVAERWKIGQKKLDNGVILLIVKEDRKMRIEVGYGHEGRLTDLRSGRIIDDIIRPPFKAGDYDKGITDGVDAIIGAVRGEYTAIDSPPASTKGDDGWRLYLPAAIAFFFIGIVGKIRRILGGIAGAVIAPIVGILVIGMSPILLALIPVGFIAGLIIPTLMTLMFLGGGRGGSGWSGSGGGGSFGGGGGFSGGGGSFGGGGASGSW
jgi:uncharacterized protein